MRGRRGQAQRGQRKRARAHCPQEPKARRPPPHPPGPTLCCDDDSRRGSLRGNPLSHADCAFGRQGFRRWAGVACGDHLLAQPLRLRELLRHRHAAGHHRRERDPCDRDFSSCARRRRRLLRGRSQVPRPARSGRRHYGHSRLVARPHPAEHDLARIRARVILHGPHGVSAAAHDGGACLRGHRLLPGQQKRDTRRRRKSEEPPRAPHIAARCGEGRRGGVPHLRVCHFQRVVPNALDSPECRERRARTGTDHGIHRLPCAHGAPGPAGSRRRERPREARDGAQDSCPSGNRLPGHPVRLRTVLRHGGSVRRMRLKRERILEPHRRARGILRGLPHRQRLRAHGANVRVLWVVEVQRT